MLASQLNQLVAEERIMENTVLRINEALVQPVNGRPCVSTWCCLPDEARVACWCHRNMTRWLLQGP